MATVEKMDEVKNMGADEGEKGKVPEGGRTKKRGGTVQEKADRTDFSFFLGDRRCPCHKLGRVLNKTVPRPRQQGFKVSGQGWVTLTRGRAFLVHEMLAKGLREEKKSMVTKWEKKGGFRQEGKTCRSRRNRKAWSGHGRKKPWHSLSTSDASKGWPLVKGRRKNIIPRFTMIYRKGGPAPRGKGVGVETPV